MDGLGALLLGIAVLLLLLLLWPLASFWRGSSPSDGWWWLALAAFLVAIVLFLGALYHVASQLPAPEYY